jgi:FSR family fosmidomycin resistance protein-like MFS transporter
MFGHFSVDMYVGVIPVLYPLLTDKFDLSLSTVGFVSLAYSGAASLTQPLFGWIADRYGTRFIGLALAWTAMMFSMIGFAPSFGVLLLIAGLAGIGSGAYHPMGAVNARAVINEGQRNSAMSIYVTGGTLGVASGPLVGALVFYLFDLEGTAVMLVPGLCAAIWMLFEMRTISQRLVRRANAAAAAPPIPYRALAVVVGMMALRSWTISGMQAYIPTWYKELGYSAFYYSALVTVLLVSTAFGTVGVGTFADRHGRRLPLIASSIISVPAILLFAQFPGNAGFLTAALIGTLASSALPLLGVGRRFHNRLRPLAPD